MIPDFPLKFSSIENLSFYIFSAYLYELSARNLLKIILINNTGKYNF